MVKHVHTRYVQDSDTDRSLNQHDPSDGSRTNSTKNGIQPDLVTENHVYASNFNTDTLYKLDVDTYNQVWSTSYTRLVSSPTYIPQSDEIVFGTGSANQIEIRWVDASDGSTLRSITYDRNSTGRNNAVGGISLVKGTTDVIVGLTEAFDDSSTYSEIVRINDQGTIQNSADFFSDSNPVGSIEWRPENEYVAANGAGDYYVFDASLTQLNSATISSTDLITTDYNGKVYLTYSGGTDQITRRYTSDLSTIEQEYTTAYAGTPDEQANVYGPTTPNRDNLERSDSDGTQNWTFTASVLGSTTEVMPQKSAFKSAWVTTLSGTAVQGGSGVSGAKVYVIDASDNSIITTTTTDTNGDWSADVSPGITVHVAAEYDDGTDQYNVKSYPFINT